MKCLCSECTHKFYDFDVSKDRCNITYKIIEDATEESCYFAEKNNRRREGE